MSTPRPRLSWSGALPAAVVALALIAGVAAIPAVAPAELLAFPRSTGPALPTFTARLQAGKALVKYCWPSLPADAHKRPWLL